MNMIPFPPTIAERSAATATRSHNSDASKRRARNPAEYTEHGGLAVYQQEGSRPTTAYDLYKPAAPAGAIVGIGKVRYSPRYSINGHEGYASHVVAVEPVIELTRSDPLHSAGRAMLVSGEIALAHVTNGESSVLLWAADEAEMQAQLDALPAGSRVARPVLDLLEQDRLPGFAFYMRNSHTEFCVAGPTLRGVAQSTAARFSMDLPKDADPGVWLDSAVEAIRGRGATVILQRGPAPRTDAYLGRQITLLNEPAVAALGPIKVAERALFKAPVPIWAAAITLHGADPAIVWAGSETALEARIANTLGSLKDSKTRLSLFTGLSVSGASIARSLSEMPGIEVRRGQGFAHLARGFEPCHFVVAPDRNLVFATSAEQDLLRVAREALTPDLLRNDVEDISEMSWHVEQAGGEALLEMKQGNLCVRLARMRDILHPEPSMEI